LGGEYLLVTAGPTQEPWDEVRYLSNRSSGKMGYAVAEAGYRRGARVVLVSGPTQLDPPAGVQVVRVRTAEQMAQAVLHHFEQATVTLMAAAVADFRPVEVFPHKLKKQGGIPQLKLEHTPDILAMLASRRRPGQVVVGFSAETENLLANAAAKVRAKHLDFIVANDVSQPGAGFDVETNIVTLVFPDGHTKPLEKMSKLEAAQRILDEVVAIRQDSGFRIQDSEEKKQKAESRRQLAGPDIPIEKK
jgi:phosphopantothenoylcysteine decarboxylase/phosphopantothenate--cysteine ligase